jgi:alpha-glucoside transport system substrate-binding protein
MRTGRTRSPSRLLAAVTAVALMAMACGADEETDEDGIFADDEVQEGGEPGTLTILHALTGDDAVLAGFQAAMEQFSDETGIAVQEQGSADFEQLARSRIEGGNPPDIVLHPQPGMMRDMIDQDLAVPASDFVDLDRLEDEMIEGLVELGEWDDDFYGLIVRLSLKSLVWYDPAGFEAGGYEVPETWEEMVDLSAQMRDDGQTPWCIGIEASDATGWVATDWLEDIMLRLHGEDAYDAWVEGELGFDSPEVREAIEDYLNPIWFTDGFVFGDTPNILQTSFGDSVLGLFDDQCLMHRQASFIEDFFPEGVTIGEDVDFFYLPEIAAADVGEPVLIAGDLAVAYTDNPDNEAFFEHFTHAEAGEPWATGAYLSPFADFDTSAYAEEALAEQGEIVANADFARFDGSDMMPGAVGSGAFWTEMVNYIQREGEDLDTALSNIDEAWPDQPG